MTLTDTIIDHLENARDDAEGHRLFPREDWRYEVGNDDTSLGYDKWLENKIEFEAAEAADTVTRFLGRALRAGAGEISEIEFSRDVLDTFSALRIYDDEAVEKAAEFLGRPWEKLVFGETFGAVPPAMAFDVNRVAQEGMMVCEGAMERGQLEQTIADVANRHDLTEISARARGDLGGEAPAP